MKKVMTLVAIVVAALSLSACCGPHGCGGPGPGPQGDYTGNSGFGDHGGDRGPN
ncbi:hypothetical protein RYD26_07835 [Pasteurellaceae bacterium LIM206]|nr:hypothetical protein [Pasteurellaceae bacterium LIM206]